MKKKILYIVIGIVLYFILYCIFDGLFDEDLANKITPTIFLVFFILLTFVSYAKNIYNSIKNTETNSWVIGFFKHRKLGIFVDTLYYIALWNFLVFLIFSYNGLNIIDNALIGTSFFAFLLADSILIIYSMSFNHDIHTSRMKTKEEEYEKLRSKDEFSFDSKFFKQHYAKPFYIILYIFILLIVIIIIESLITTIFDIHSSWELSGFLILIIPAFIIYIMWIYGNKNNFKKFFIISLDPLSVERTIGSGNARWGYYQKTKRYFIDEVFSYKLTNRYIIVEGKIQFFIRETNKYGDNEKNKIVSRFKIPRVYNNENLLIEALENKRLENKE